MESKSDWRKPPQRIFVSRNNARRNNPRLIRTDQRRWGTLGLWGIMDFLTSDDFLQKLPWNKLGFVAGIVLWAAYWKSRDKTKKNNPSYVPKTNLWDQWKKLK